MKHYAIKKDEKQHGMSIRLEHNTVNKKLEHYFDVCP